MKVLIVKRYERDFRIPFYRLLKSKLSEKGIDLELHYGEPDEEEKKSIRDYIKDESIGRKVRNKYFKIKGTYLCYQPCLSLVSKADIVVVQQGNRELFNYALLFRRFFFRKPKLVFWGHGRNFQGNPKSLKEKFKYWYSNKVDFWIAYNELSKKLLTDRGFDPGRIVAINNTIDSKSQIEYYDSITESQKEKLKEQYGIKPGDPVGIFCASIYHDKQIDFLLNALSLVKSKVPNFKFLMVGKGVEDYKPVEYAKNNPGWFFYVGNKFHEEKILYFSIADFQTIPGAVGLNIIDSFSFRCPLITTKIDNHGPEISYLESYKNGIMTNVNLEEYADTIITLTSDKTQLDRLKQGCSEARSFYSIENMANNFFNGVLTLLSKPHT